MKDKPKKVNHLCHSRSIGVVYLSRIPPYMKASQIRKYFEEYGVCRIYLSPEGIVLVSQIYDR